MWWRVKAKTLLILCTAFWLTACTTLGFLYLNRSVLREHLHITRDVAYGKQPWQKLDIYQPAKAEAPLPVVLFFYGGGWTKGDKADYLFVAERLVRAGFVVVIPDYVKYPQAKFPTFMHDVALAAKWLHTHAKDYAGDPENLHLMGHSAGGLMGALLLSDKHYLADVGLTPAIFRSFVGLAGPYDFTPDEEPYLTIFGPPSNYPNMQVTHFIDGTEPPMLLQYGQADDVVGYSNIEKLVPRIEQKQGKVEVRLYPKHDHIDVIADFSEAWAKDSPVVTDAIAFLKTHAGVKP